MDRNVHQFVRLCAGLPQVGDRKLTELERSELLSEVTKNTCKFIFIITAVILFIAGLIWLVWNTYELYLNGLLLIFMFLILLFGVPFAILTGCDSYDRVRLLQKALKFGTVQRFEGDLQNSDWTNANFEILRKTKLLKPESSQQTIELFPVQNFIYKINGVRAKVHRKLHLTSAAMPDPQTPHFSLPAAWVEPEISESFERRRLSEEECLEIVRYAKKMRGRIIIIFFLNVLCCEILGILLLAVGLPPFSCLRISAITCVICGSVLVLRQEFRARRILKDSEFGWAIIHLPVQVEHIVEKRIKDSAKIEVLPMSRLIWRINEKPAGWRGEG